MSYTVPSPRSDPGVITAIQSLLWIQFGLGIMLCWCDLLIVYVVASGSFHAGVPSSPGFGTGVLVFWFLLVAAMPQLVVIAVKLTIGGPDARKRALRVWALWVLATPLLLLAGFAVYAAVDADLYNMGALQAVAVMAVLHVPVPVAAIACLFTPAARAWFHRKPEPSMRE
ncbi:hypothetical protein FB566_5290 [Stackebrandtia endophytica]|uniref:Uncharacterized protein n=1 Tax=Stackebrandtia endophytica TaxID=1496996 RepID=A0A543B4C0_9ACTN|nr:hypothetical protein [Stackebrandtia endophytica]TQL79679.1 hypothetical protein FB566_5290 [Stackebrandtia endophytica]